jgi:hypothetical protein
MPSQEQEQEQEQEEEETRSLGGAGGGGGIVLEAGGGGGESFGEAEGRRGRCVLPRPWLTLWLRACVLVTGMRMP